MMALRSTLSCLPTVALLLVAASLLAPPAPAQPVEVEAAAPYRVKRLFFGCWTRTTVRPGHKLFPISEATRCFQTGRALAGYAFDAGDGWDFCESWHVDQQRLAMRDDYGNAQRCLYAFSEDRKTLILRDCDSAGDWKWDDSMHKSVRSDGNICRGRKLDLETE